MVRKKILVLAILMLSVTANPFVKEIASEEKQPSHLVESKMLDKRAEILAAYLATHNSPLQYHAQDFIDAANTYDVDWKLVPAIAGVESTFGKHIPGGYNAWGWAIYTPDSRFGFKSWRDGIFTVTKGLREDYINRGLTNPYTMNKRYAASPAWGWKVDFFITKIDSFAKGYESNTSQRITNPLSKTAGSSAQLALDSNNL